MCRMHCERNILILNGRKLQLFVMYLPTTIQKLSLMMSITHHIIIYQNFVNKSLKS